MGFYCLGVPWREVGLFTPREIDRLTKCLKSERLHSERIGAIISMTMARYGFKDSKYPPSYDDFTLSSMIEKAQKSRSAYSADAQINLLRGWYGTGIINKPVDQEGDDLNAE